MRPAQLRKTVLFVLLAGLLIPCLALAEAARNWDDDDHSYDKARRAVARGEALPVTEVMKYLRVQVPGDVVATEYEYEFERWVYEFRVVDPQGHLRKVHLDAATGELVDPGQD
jgi:uncharacterized membrane protein YkoI